MTIKLTSTQLAILRHATETPGDGCIDWFPDNVKGGARQKVISALSKRDLITDVDGVWHVSQAGYLALGEQGVDVTIPAISQTPVEADPELGQAIQAVEAQWMAGEQSVSLQDSVTEPSGRPVLARAGSKQAQVLAMLSRPEGTTIARICEATGWQVHTVRGMFAGVIRRKLALDLVSEKCGGADRIYRIRCVSSAKSNKGGL